jgi:hypothetical protein
MDDDPNSKTIGTSDAQGLITIELRKDLRYQLTVTGYLKHQLQFDSGKFVLLRERVEAPPAELTEFVSRLPEWLPHYEKVDEIEPQKDGATDIPLTRGPASKGIANSFTEALTNTFFDAIVEAAIREHGQEAVLSASDEEFEQWLKAELEAEGDTRETDQMIASLRRLRARTVSARGPHPTTAP